MHRYLSHYILFNGRVYRNSIVEVDGDIVNIHKFEREIENTIYVNGLVLISKIDATSIIDKFRNIVRCQQSLDNIANEICSIVKESESMHQNSNNNPFQIYILER